jgi:hypothetical protein
MSAAPTLTPAFKVEDRDLDWRHRPHRFLRCFHSSALAVCASLIAVLIWIRSCALPAAVIEDGWHRVAAMT